MFHPEGLNDLNVKPMRELLKEKRYPKKTRGYCVVQTQAWLLFPASAGTCNHL